MRDFGEPRRRFLETTTLAAAAVLLSPKKSLAQIVESEPQVEPSATQGESSAADYNPGLSLFHCHQQLHMDFGFMTLFDYSRARRLHLTSEKKGGSRRTAFSSGDGSVKR